MKFQPNPGRRQSVFPLNTRQSHEKQPVCDLVYPFRQVSGRTTSGTDVRFPVSSPREVNITVRFLDEWLTDRKRGTIFFTRGGSEGSH